MKTQTLKPGLLVSLKTSVRGGVNYQRLDLEKEHVTESGEKIARWETKKEVNDPAEYDRAMEIRNEARKMIVRVCCNSSFGLLCPLDKEAELIDAITSARESARNFNASTSAMSVDVYVLSGRIATTDEEATSALRAELYDLMNSMDAGIKAADPVAIRDAANKARMLSGMLTEESEQKVGKAIEQARKAARALTKRVEKAGELAADVLQDIQSNHIATARFEFLDIAPERDVTPEAIVARGVDLDVQTETLTFSTPNASSQWFNRSMEI